VKVGWQFDRGVPEPGQPVAIRCTFTLADPTAETTCQFVIPEQAALDLIEAIRKVASPLTVAGNGTNHGGN
jgi:hypothetical protein